jgi:zinc protease
MSTRRKPQTARNHLKALPGSEDVHRVTLPNGIVVLGRANFNSPSVVINGYVNAGSLFDPDEKLGLADFTSAMLMHGTERRNFQQIYDTIESIGANLGFSAGTHTTSFSGRCLAEDLPRLMALLAESVREPAFPADEIKRLRAQLLTGLAIRAQDTADMASITFDRIVFAGHPYSRPEDGWPETIEAITRRDLVKFHHRHYGPKGMVIATVGAIEPAAAADLARRALGDWQNGLQPAQPELPPLKGLKKIVRRHVPIPGKSQTDIMIGASGPMRRSPEYMAASLGNSVLGQFGMMGRIGNIVRERSGLAYYAYSSLSAGIGPGAWEVSAGVNPANVEKAIDLIRKEIQRFVRNGVRKDELDDSRANFIGRLPLSLESNAGVANALVNIERYDLGLDYYRRYQDLVRDVKAEEVVETTRKYLHPDRLAIVTAGVS